MRLCSSLGSPKAEPKTIAWVWVVYLAGDARKQEFGDGRVRQGRRECQCKGRCPGHCCQQQADLRRRSEKSVECLPDAPGRREAAKFCSLLPLQKAALRAVGAQHFQTAFICTGALGSLWLQRRPSRLRAWGGTPSVGGNSLSPP